VPAAPIAVADGVAATDRERLSGRVAVRIALDITLAVAQPIVLSAPRERGCSIGSRRQAALR
jgi:hypothetical protein